MPWSEEKPPRIAKGWNTQQIRDCVSAANGTIAAGGSDDEAIFQCALAAGKLNEDAQLAKSWYHINALAEVPEVYLFDEIGLFGVSAKEFINELNAITAPNITVRINSPGGSVGDGMAIYNAIKRHPAKIKTAVDGVALSIASLIASAGDPVTAAPGAVFMLHSPWSSTEGNATELHKTADALDATQRGMVTAYTEKTGKSQDEIMAMLQAETWLSADEAVEFGLCDHIEGELMTASYKHLSQFEEFKTMKAPTKAKEVTNINAAAIQARNNEMETIASPWMGDKEIRGLYASHLRDISKTAEDFRAETLAILGQRSGAPIEQSHPLLRVAKLSDGFTPVSDHII